MELSAQHNYRTVFARAFLVRFATLVIILLIGGGMARGFIGENTYYDDYRYELGGKYYAEHADSLIDVRTFTEAYASVGDWIGYKFADTPLESSPLWYWLVCILMYLTKTFVTVRLFNVLVASLAIVNVCKFATEAYGYEIAKKATKILTFLPYPVIFSCFAYKDQLIMLLTFYLLWAAVRYRNAHELPFKRLVAIILSAVALLFVRGGLSAILIMICLIIAFEKAIRGRLNAKTLLLLSLAVVAGIVVVGMSYQMVIYKLNYYLNRHAETLTGTSISFITINSISEIYKLPFTYIFSIIMPIGLNSGWGTWYGIVAHLNILMTPIAVGSSLYMLCRKKETLIYWGCTAYYLASIVASINIFRHYYSLIPFSLIAFSAYSVEKKNSMLLVYGLGIGFALLLMLYYLV